MQRKNQGITLVALIITVIIMLILAGVAISLTIGDNGIFQKAQQGSNQYKQEAKKEEGLLEAIDSELEKELASNGNDTIKEMQIFTFGDKTEEYDGISGKEEEFIVPATGYYRLEVWGAQGGGAGNGGYSSGYVKLTKGEKLYVYIGGRGLDTAYVGANAQKGGFNGGGDSGIPSYYSSFGKICDAMGSGGGATDIRKIKASEGSWYDVEHEDWSKDKSLLSRIIVAGGGRTAVGEMMAKQEVD